MYHHLRRTSPRRQQSAPENIINTSQNVESENVKLTSLPPLNTSETKKMAPEPFNIIHDSISSNLSSSDEADFLWVTNVNCSILKPVLGAWSPTAGAVALFLHSDGKQLLIKGRGFEPGVVARKIKTLDGYAAEEQKPLILAACRAGDGGGQSIAQSVADTLQRSIIASSGLVHIATDEEKTRLVSIYSEKPFEIFNPHS